MNDPGNFKDDILKQYLNPGKAEKAPESFTSRLMSRVGYEPAYKVTDKPFKRNLIPVISAGFVTLLLIAALLLPKGNSKDLLIPASDFIKNAEGALSKLNNLTLPSIDFPVLLSYLITGILLIGLFDLALSKLLYRRHK